MLPNDPLSGFMIVSFVIQLCYIRTLIKANNALPIPYRLNQCYFYGYPLALLIFYYSFETGIALKYPYVGLIVNTFIPLLGFSTFILKVFTLLYRNGKVIRLLGLKEKYFFTDISGLGVYLFSIAMLFGTISHNLVVIAAMITSGITHWIFVNRNANFLIEKQPKTIK